MEDVDQVGGEEIAHDGWAASDSNVKVAGRLAGEVEHLGGAPFDEVEDGSALHLD